ncbi:hypothetical protein EV421DRAFT_1738091 [Armillaria borealis]|uniref:Uncharacterized protein n=1 Tax=Armillaria borealis TaxID=47425 RepID=A0AA39JE25_9AGAR|nr:hypothetical protein EV421DRAFT_1738091 [Armillaria borealis]
MKPIKLCPKRRTKEGFAAAGISVLAVIGWVVHTGNKEILLRHDSGADVSLISEDFYKSLTNAPTAKRGSKLKLYQLTDKNAEIEGYVRVPIITKLESGELIETEVEAYIMPKMSVPILLSEDYQLDYELTVKRTIAEGCSISYQDNPEWTVKATRVDKLKEYDHLHASACSLQSFVKARNHRRRKNQRARAKQTESQNEYAVRATFKKGEILGWAQKVEEFLDKPKLEEHKQAMAKTALLAEEIIQLEMDKGNFKPKNQPLSGEEISKEEEEYGLKMAAMPENEVLSSADIKELLDVGDLPEELEEEAWNMLRDMWVCSDLMDVWVITLRKSKYPSKRGLSPSACPYFALTTVD